MDYYKDYSVAVLTATCMPKQKVGTEIEFVKTHKWLIYHAGYDRRYGNKSTGITILFSRRHYCQEMIRQTMWPKASRLHGRAMGFRIKRPGLDLLLLAMYWPPFNRGVHRDTLDCVKYAKKVLNACPNRCTPILLGDLNARCGSVPSPAFGNIMSATQKETAQGKLLRELCEQYGLRAANSFAPNCHHTYYRRGTPTSRVDWVCVGNAIWEDGCMQGMYTSTEAAYDLQHVDRAELIDHIPIIFAHPKVTLTYAKKAKHIKWDYNKLYLGWMAAHNKQSFHEDFNQLMSANKDQWRQVVATRNPTQMLDFLIKDMNAAGEKFFSKDAKAAPPVHKWQQAKDYKLQLLKSRQQLRQQHFKDCALKKRKMRAWLFWKVQLELKKQTKAIKEAVRDERRQIQKYKEQEIEHFWHQRNLKAAWETVRSCTSTKRGAARKSGNSTLSSRLDAKQTLELLSKPSHQGGWSASQINDEHHSSSQQAAEALYEENKNTPITDVKYSSNAEAEEWMKIIPKMVMKLKNGKYTPTTDSPAELWKMCIRDNWTCKKVPLEHKVFYQIHQVSQVH